MSTDSGPQSLDARLLRYRGGRGGEHAAALASDLLDAGRSADAQEVLATALAAAPDDPDLLVADGRARLSRADLLGAQAALLKAAKITPQRKEPFRWLGEVLLKRGDPARAAKVLERALAIDPNDRSVTLLHQRASRLAHVAMSAGDDPPAKRASEPPRAQAPEERTVIRTDLTEQLRTIAREADARDKAAAAEPALTLAHASPAERFDDESTTNERGALPPADFEEDEPTNIVGGKDVQALHRAVASAPVQAPAPPRRPVKRTLAFGAAPDRPAPPAGGLADAPPRPARPIPPKKPAARPAPPFSPSNGDASAKPSAPFPPPKGAPFPPAKSPPKADPPFAPSAADAVFPPAAEPARQSSPPREPELGRDVFPVMPAPPEALERPSGPAPEPARPSDPGLPELGSEAPAEAVDLEPTADVAVGGADSEDVDRILDMLRAQGLFEAPTGPPAQWAGRADVREAKKAGGTRIGLWLGIVWVLAIGLAVGGYYGWQALVARRHQQAAALVEQAKGEAYRGDHSDLVDAERHLREARELDPRDVNGPALLLFVHAQRALEDGAFEAGYLRPTITRGERLHAEEAYLEIARAVLAAAEGGQDDARTRLASALEARARDPMILYLAGRLEQRLGSDDATEHLEAAVEGEPRLVAPRIALAELRYDGGQADEALTLLDQVREAQHEHLRGTLWRAFMTSDTEEPAGALTAIGEREHDVEEHGAPTDRVLLELTRAHLLRRQGNADGAGAAVDAALLAGASEPRLLALVANEARHAGRMLRAEQAARTAVTGAPGNADFRKLLGEIQLARRDGRGALATLAELDAADPDVLAMRARAALLVGTDEALRAAAEGLDAYVQGSEDASVEARALRIRTHVRLGDDLLPEARALSQEAPGDPNATLALGEAGLLAHDADAATEALSQAVLASPDDAEAHYLLGRAKRMAGDGEGAVSSFRRAIELTPEHTEARLALGGLLLDLGRYQEADELYTELSRSARSTGGLAVTVAGRLGRVEALIGLGRLADADVQLEAVQQAARETPSARITAARLALAKNRPGDALTELRALASEASASATVLALYGDALLAAGQVDPAAAAYESALAKDAGLPEALLGRAEMFVRGERGDDALETLGQLASSLERRIRPPSMSARLHLLRGRAHLANGRSELEAAREELRQAVAIEGAPAEAQFFLGEALAGENAPEARAAYQRYLELAPEGPYAARARRAAGRR